MPRVAFITLGCKVNQFDSAVSEGLFRQHGYDVVDFDELADVYVINTCVVTNTGERKSRQIIHRAIRRNPSAVIVVTGCYAQTNPAAVKKIPGVDLIIGNQNRHKIVDLVEEAKNKQQTVNAVQDIMHTEEFEDIPLYYSSQRTRAFLKIQEGCTNFCTYCIIPFARGPLRSRSLDSIKQETINLVAAGYKEIVLTGIHLGAYGYDQNPRLSLVDAVRTVLAVDGVTRLRLGSLESIEVDEDIINIMMKDQRLCAHLHLPLQSGDDTILRKMNRPYTVQQYQNLIMNIKEKIPKIAITTDIIAGFPGETEEMFVNSLKFLRGMDFLKIHIFPYSQRTGTPAATFPDQISTEEKKLRVQRLEEVARQNAEQFMWRFIGTTVDVLFETERQGIVDGLSENYIRIYSAGNTQILGTIGGVKITGLYKDGAWGELQ